MINVNSPYQDLSHTEPLPADVKLDIKEALEQLCGMLPGLEIQDVTVVVIPVSGMNTHNQGPTPLEEELLEYHRNDVESLN